MNHRALLRHFAFVCAVFCAIGLNAMAHEDAAKILSLKELKSSAASRSTYLREQPQSETPTDASETPKTDLAKFKQSIEPILTAICVECHGPEVEEGNVRIDRLNPDLINGADVDRWLEVLAVLNNGEMPPPDATELNEEQRSMVVQWLSSEMQIASKVRRAAGEHSSFRRLTRYEFNYALQDLLGLPWDFARDLPPDAISDDGFQNSSEMLHMSVTQLETYRQLALKAMQRATVRGERPPVIHWSVTMKQAADREWSKQDAELEKLKAKFKDDPAKQKQELDRLRAKHRKPNSRTYYRELSSGRTARAEWSYPSAKYAFAPAEKAEPIPETFDHVAVIPQGRNQYLTVELGDRLPDEGILRVRVRASRASDDATKAPSLQLHFGWQASNEGRAQMLVSKQDKPIEANPDSPEIYQWDVPLGEIYPRNSVRNISHMGALPSPSEYIRFVNSSVPQGGHGDILIDYVQVSTPVNDQWPPPSHNRIFIKSEDRDDESTYARQVLVAFMSRAWRKAVSVAEIDRKVELFGAIRPECESFEEAMLEVLATVLSSPNFLYVVSETDSREDEQGVTRHDQSNSLSTHELAIRLSLFLWCSVPDEELLSLAASEQLRQPEILDAQVKRMLADARSNRFAEHFVHQWLDMQLLDFLAIEKNSPHVDTLMKAAMRREPIELFQEMLKKDASVLDFIHAEYTMANERLASYYGIANDGDRKVRGNQFRRVKLEEKRKRGGLLTQAGLLAMNSDGKDSHPLKRGIWLLESLLNDPPPPPPPAVPEIDLADPEIAKLTLKQRIEDHRNHAACLSCHVKIDPWGIAFENYDATGRWRDQINGQPVDSASMLFNKQKLDGMDGLKRFLLEHRQDQFVRAMVYKLATFAIGRPMTFTDRAKIDDVTAEVRRNGDGLATMIRLLVASDLFQSQ